jgi:hypothetical protein
MSKRARRVKRLQDATVSTQQLPLDFDEELARIREASKVARPRTRMSKLDPHREGILNLWGRDASLREIVVWLRRKTPVSAAPSTVMRYLDGLLGEGQ